tara:strand:- start:182 stop:544 length:363 start_codon:yes stop_codon:yes gene_type:complete
MIDIILKTFDSPDEIRTFDKGKFELVKLKDMTIGRATYDPGWKWSINVSPLTSSDFCEVEHIGIVLSGSATVSFKNNQIYTLNPGNLFYVSPEPHDSWVIGNEQYISLHFLGAEIYADQP